MTTAKTDRVVYRFTVREYGDGTPWIGLETHDGKELRGLGDGFLGFDLPDGTTYERAKAIAEWLKENIKAVSHTRFVPEFLQDKPF